MAIAVSGSLAYDYIMNFPDTFQRHILPEKLHVLSVSFLVDRLEKNWGGTGGNIAYALSQLGASPLLISSLGTDGGEYLTHLKKAGISTKLVFKDQKSLTASAHIISDQNDNQIAGFFPGPSDQSAKIGLQSLKGKAAFALISPNPKAVMLAHLKTFCQQKTTIVFDPGQALLLFEQEELRQAIEMADYLISNDYEMQLLQEKSGWSMQEIIQRMQVVVTTLGKDGSRIQTDHESLVIAAAHPSQVLDPTGAGDAFRAGFFVGQELGKDLKTSAQMGNITACYAIESYGSQAYSYTAAEFITRYQATYQESLTLYPHAH